MPKKQSSEDLSVDELRRLLVEKRRGIRQERLERFRRTGRVVTLIPDTDTSSLENLRPAPEEEDQPAAQRSKPKRVLDGILLVIEVSAVLGLLFVLFNGLEIIRNLNQQVAEVLVQPTLTPTPLVVAVVIPGGHTPPNSPGGARPNDAEIPEHLQPLVQSLANIPIPTPGPEQGIRIQIPPIHVDAPIVQGDNWEQLKKGVGQHIGSANPGEKNNMVLTGHDDVFGEIFRDLEKLRPGDQVILFTSQHSYIYIVTGSKIVEKNQVEVMAPSKKAIVTLITCYPYMVDNKRIVVTAELLQSGAQ
ncbi:MAG: sortase [Omnitrophica WOR_2 bacterium]